ncbi:hypothetical protein Pmani_001080 [Petrolisthes manimaculis]|uniref:Fucosyltransferase n=1 Tax=Petrolisthes manimaculis TaxID=1843537 RepID=A0AAE1QLN2_9EUCA|nr:hypothetical protein Pmani_001080 [Petrolisthes manimaculis]
MFYVLHNGGKYTPLYMLNSEAIYNTCRSKTLFNKFGLAISFDEILRYHSDMTYYVIATSQDLVSHPSQLKPSQFTLRAFDKFDHKETTMSGTGGSHDTVMFLMQDKATDVSSSKLNMSDTANVPVSNDLAIEHTTSNSSTPTPVIHLFKVLEKVKPCFIHAFGDRPSNTHLELGESHLPYVEEDILQITDPDGKILNKPAPPPDPHGPPLKKILFWNDAYSNKHFGFGYGREPFLRAKCPVNTCYTTSNRSLFPLNEIDAVVWHWRSSDRSFPKKRWPHTRYVFWMMESASHMVQKINPYRNHFNWTLTYRLDSDFPFLYGQVYRRRHPLPDQYRNYAQGKTKMAAWFVSNCHTIGGRESVVKILRRWIQVDQYGGCGPLKCSREQANNCEMMLSKDYKFYLSFENSLCKDYVTEKLFSKLRIDVLPVVYGFGNYSMLAPPHSYIDALSFPNVKALADYLLYLHHNDTAYNQYFAVGEEHSTVGPVAGEYRLTLEVSRQNHKAEENIRYALGQLCSMLPSTLRDECQVFVDAPSITLRFLYVFLMRRRPANPTTTTATATPIVTTRDPI